MVKKADNEKTTHFLYLQKYVNWIFSYHIITIIYLHLINSVKVYTRLHIYILYFKSQQLDKGEDDVKICCRLWDVSNGTCLHYSICNLEVQQSSIVRDPVLLRHIRVERKQFYHIIVSINRRAYFLPGIHLFLPKNIFFSFIFYFIPH